MLVFKLDKDRLESLREHFVNVWWESEPVGKKEKSEIETPCFSIHTFRKPANREEENGIQSICDLCNRFFATLSVEEQWKIFRYFKRMYHHLTVIEKGDSETYRVQKDEMTRLTEEIFLHEIPLYDRVMSFIHSLNISPPEMEGKGNRVQDSKEKTFTPEEYPLVYGVSLVCKILFPIIGHSLEIFKMFCGIESRELYTYQIFESLFNSPSSPFLTIYEKIRFYIDSEVKKNLKKNKNKNKGKTSNYVFSMTNQGFCEDQFIDYVEAVVMCRKLVRFDFFFSSKKEKEPNVMVTIYVGVFETVNSKIATFQKNTNLMAMFSSEDSLGSEDNTSNMEHGSKISRVTYDINKMVEISVDNVIPRVLMDLEIDEKMFERCVKFYERNPIIQSPFNISMTSSLLDKYIGGSAMIYRLKSLQYLRLVSIVQLKMLQWDLTNLIGFMSCLDSDIKSLEVSPAIVRNKNFEKLEEFVEFRRLCPGFSEHLVQDPKASKRSNKKHIEVINVATQVQRIVNWCVDYVHYFNLPPVLLEQIKIGEESPSNGDQIEIDMELARNICQYFVNCHQKKEVVPDFSLI